MARPGRAAVGPSDELTMILGRHISLAVSSENSRLPSGRAPMASRTAIHFDQSTALVQMPPAAAAESQFQMAAIESAIGRIGPW